VKRLAAVPIVVFVLLLVGTSMAQAQPQTHTVVRGDTLWALSQRFHTTVQALATTNGIPNPNLIYVGQVLDIVPGAIPAPPVPQTVAAPTTPHRVVATAPTAAPVASGGMWACIIRRESGGNPTAVNRSSGASGLYQFMDSTWHSVTGLPGKASQYSAAVQTAAALKLQAQAGWAPWGGGCR
jgi:murein DD-endopeptidase MepM/ murein hydrolase activator NlpD